MADDATSKIAKYVGVTDEEVAAQVLRGETEMFEVIMRRHNQRLYHVARANTWRNLPGGHAIRVSQVENLMIPGLEM